MINHDEMEGVINHDVVEDTPLNGVVQPVAPPTSVGLDEHLSGPQTSAIQSPRQSPDSPSNRLTGFNDAIPRARGRGRGRGRGRPRGSSVATCGRKSLRQTSGDVADGGVADGGVVTEGPRQAVRRTTRGRGTNCHDNNLEEPLPSGRKRRKLVQSPDGGGASEPMDAELPPVAWIVGISVPNLGSLATPTTGVSASVPVRHNPPGTSNPVGILKNPRVLSNSNKVCLW